MSKMFSAESQTGVVKHGLCLQVRTAEAASPPGYFWLSGPLALIAVCYDQLLRRYGRP